MATLTAPQLAYLSTHDRPWIGLMADPLNVRRLEAALEDEFDVVARGQSIAALLDSARRPFELAVLAGDTDLLARGGAVERLRHLRPECSIVLVATSEQR